VEIKKFFTTPISQLFQKGDSISQPQASHSPRLTVGGGQDSGAKSHMGMSRRGSSLQLDHHGLRQNGRIAMQDSPQGRAIVERKTDAVAYTGLKLEPTPEIQVLGITQEEAAAWAKNTGARFNLWANDKTAHRAEEMTFDQAQWLYAFWKSRDNDVFIRLYYDNKSKNLQNPLQFEFIDPDQIRGHAYTSSHGFQFTDDGIIRDSRGRATGYKVQVKELVSTTNGINQYRYKQVTIDKKNRAGRVFMLHGFKPEYQGQGRGFTPLAPILQELQNATDFSLAHIKYAISRSRFVAWIKPSEEEDAKQILETTGTAFGDGPADDNFKSPPENATETDEYLGDIQCHNIPESTFANPDPIFIQNLLRGQDIKFPTDSAAAQMYGQFMESFVGDLSACMGTPLEVVKMKFGNSFSASRATLLLFQRIVEIERADQEADLNNPIYEMWLSGEIGAGRITAPGWSDPRLKKAWLKATWRGTPVPDIDPGKLAKARKDNLEVGATNIERESQLNSGMSADDNIAINNNAYKNYVPPPFSDAAQVEETAEVEED
jgi:capsid protein